MGRPWAEQRAPRCWKVALFPLPLWEAGGFVLRNFFWEPDWAPGGNSQNTVRSLPLTGCPWSFELPDAPTLTLLRLVSYLPGSWSPPWLPRSVSWEAETCSVCSSISVAPQAVGHLCCPLSYRFKRSCWFSVFRFLQAPYMRKYKQKFLFISSYILAMNHSLDIWIIIHIIKIILMKELVKGITFEEKLIQ